MRSDLNQANLAAYNEHIAEYIAGTPAELSSALAAWIDRMLTALPARSRILEIGSGTGRDAAYIEKHGFTVDRTDAAAGFVDHLQASGYPARLLDVLHDDLGGPHAAIFADAVFLHVERAAAPALFARLHRALRPSGVLAFTLKRGDGEEFSNAKLGAPRYFCYWQPEPLHAALKGAGFAAVEIEVSESSRQDWLMVRAVA